MVMVDDGDRAAQYAVHGLRIGGDGLIEALRLPDAAVQGLLQELLITVQRADEQVVPGDEQRAEKHGQQRGQPFDADHQGNDQADEQQGAGDAQYQPALLLLGLDVVQVLLGVQGGILLFRAYVSLHSIILQKVAQVKG